MKFRPLLISLSLILLALEGTPLASGQATKPYAPTAVNDKAERITQQAITAVGGNNYLSLRTVVGHGLFAPYQDGAPQVPSKFVDYIVFPDKERTEFNSSGGRVIQTNTGDSGWIFDGAAKTLKDQKANQIEDFKIGMLTSIENLLRGWWRKKGATLSYAGRREAGLGYRNETVRLTYPDGFWVEYEFGAKDGLPAKVVFQRKHKNADSGAMEDIPEEDHLLKLITIDGVTSPFVVDHFIKGVQTSRVSYDTIEYNRELPDSLFAKPATIKGLK
jgi:hypothetical protein